MTGAPVFTGRVLDGGLLVLDRPKDYAKHVRAHRGQYVEVTLRRRRQKRSDPQNRWLWGCAYQLIVEDVGYDTHEWKAAKEALHYELVKRCFGVRYDERLKAEIPHARSSRLDTKQFSDYMEWLVRYAATEYHVVIPLPNEVDLSTLPDWEAA